MADAKVKDGGVISIQVTTTGEATSQLLQLNIHTHDKPLTLNTNVKPGMVAAMASVIQAALIAEKELRVGYIEQKGESTDQLTMVQFPVPDP